MSANTNLPNKLIHTKTIAVRWGDMDAYSHVNNTSYFSYAQEARFDMLIDTNNQIDAQGISPVLAETSCKFIRPIYYPKTIDIETWFMGTNDKKVFFEHIIKATTEPDITYAIIQATITWYDFKHQKSTLIPNHILHDFLR